MPMREDREFQEFRDLMKAPKTFEDGFSLRTVVMALFVGLVMAPASEYMSLVAGLGLGPAAKWVTVILYVEICRRAFLKLKRPEIFVLFYMCGAAMGVTGHGLLWKQFLAQSEEFQKLGLTQYLPWWWGPTDPEVLSQRNFFMRPWIIPACIGAFMGLISRIDDWGLGYIIYRMTADVEQLPFPMAPVGAAGMTALADSSIGIHFLYFTQPPALVPGIVMQEQSEDLYSAFSEMAQATGGLSTSSANPEFLFQRAGDAADNYYLLYYTPSNYTGDGAFKNIRVRVRGKSYRVTHRAGYFAD